MLHRAKAAQVNMPELRSYLPNLSGRLWFFTAASVFLFVIDVPSVILERGLTPALWSTILLALLGVATGIRPGIGGGLLVATCGLVQLLPERACVVDLDPRYYKRIADFEARFPHGVPSIREASSLTVRGDWSFGGGVVAAGDAAVDEAGAPGRSPTAPGWAEPPDEGVASGVRRRASPRAWKLDCLRQLGLPDSSRVLHDRGPRSTTLVCVARPPRGRGTCTGVVLCRPGSCKAVPAAGAAAYTRGGSSEPVGRDHNAGLKHRVRTDDSRTNPLAPNDMP